jgi:O-antigen ligase
LVKSIGYLAWATFDIVVVWWGLILWINNQTRLRHAFLFWGCGMAIDAAMGAFQWCCWLFGYFPPLAYSDGYGFPRINGFSYEPSYYALYLVPGAIFFLTRFAFLGRSAWRSGLASVALALLSMLSTSRSGWLGLAVGVTALGIIVVKNKGFIHVRSLALPLAGVIILFSTFLLAIPSTRERIVRLSSMAFNPLEKTSSQPRLKGMQQAWQMFSDHPWLGVGFGNYGAYVLTHPQLQFSSPAPSGITSGPQQAHAVVTSNLYLELAAESGILGLSAALIMIAVLVLPLLRPKTNQFENLLPDELLEWEATRWGLLLAGMVVFGVLFQFSQTLWRLDIWSFLALSCAAYRLSFEPSPGVQKDSPLHL